MLFFPFLVSSTINPPRSLPLLVVTAAKDALLPKDLAIVTELSFDRGFVITLVTPLQTACRSSNPNPRQPLPFFPSEMIIEP